MRLVPALLIVAVSAVSSAQVFRNTFTRSGVQSGVSAQVGAALANGNYAFALTANTASALYIMTQQAAIVRAASLRIGATPTRCKSMSVDPTTGNIYTVGEIAAGPNARQLALHKFTPTGTQLWSRTIDPGNMAYESAVGSVCDRFGNFIFIGHSGANAFPSGSEQAFVVRIRPNGAISFDTDLTGVLTYGRTVCVGDNGDIHASSYTNFQSYYWRIDGTTGMVETTDDLPPSSFCENIFSTGNRVFLAGVGVPPSLTQRPLVTTYDATTGAVLWSTFVTSPTVSGGIFQKVLTDGAGFPIAAGDMVDGAEVGMVTKFNPANGAIIWHRKVGNSSQQRTYAGFSIDLFNESILQTRLVDTPNSFVRIDAFGPSGSFRGGITVPSSSPSDTIPQNLIYEPTHARGMSLGIYGGGAAQSRWVGFERAPIAINDSYTTVRNNTLNANSVNANDRFWDNAITALNTSPSNGGIVFDNDGTFTYTPGNNFVGPDSFTYSLTRPGLPPAIGTVNINVIP